MKSRTILLIDGENFLHKIKEVLKEAKTGGKRANLSRININFLLEKTLKNSIYQGNYSMRQNCILTQKLR